MQQIARTRSRVWFSIVFKRGCGSPSYSRKCPIVALRSNRLPSFIGDEGLGNLQKETTAARTEHAG